jgi:hypothetical protein
MKHDYTPKKILYAWNHRKYLPGQRGKTLDNLKAFLDALPERPQAQPTESSQTCPWPGQQEAIDAAMIEAGKNVPYNQFVGSKDLFPNNWPKEAPARLAIAQAYDKARPQAAEIASLKAELEKAESKLKPEIEALHDTISNLKAELSERRRKLAYAEEHLGILAKTFGYEGRTWCNMVSYLSPRLQKAESDLAKIKAELAAQRAEAFGKTLNLW